jgi:phosphoglycolate phosphatase-like HAD superfamily hydrolase
VRPGPVVLFWDLDGTLLTTARAGVYALEEAAHTVLGIDLDLQRLRTSGLTDAQIAELIMRESGCVRLEGDGVQPADVARFLDAYGAALPAHLPRRQGTVMPGVRAILEDLAGDGRVLNLLLTGNIEAGAHAKLRHYGLDRLISEGAFCQGPGERVLIARDAVRLATSRLGTAPDPRRTYVIGDTPHDIQCAHAVGLRSIAVATGEYAAPELADIGAWRVLESLPAPAQFRALVGLPS